MASRIGFLGMGIMGRPMSKNLADKGFSVVVQNRSPLDPAEFPGRDIVKTAQEAAQGADAVVSMLTGPEALEAVYFGETGAVRGLKFGTTAIDCSTIPPEFAKSLSDRLAGLGIRFIHAPVSGSKKQAEEALLVMLASGEEKAVQSAEPILAALGKKTVYCGPVPAGAMMKLAINGWLAGMGLALCEALHFSQKAGLDPALFYDVLQSGAMASPWIGMKRDNILSGEFAPQFPLKHMLKDLKYVLDAAHESGAASPQTLSGYGVYRAAEAMGLGERDMTAVLSVLRTLGG